MSNPEHLRVETSDRGFDRLPSIPGTYGGAVRVCESSAAISPHIWLNVKNQPTGPSADATVHLTAENAWRLAEQITFLVENHYQGDARPADARSEDAPLRAALAELVALKDGPRDTHYRAAKDAAWDRARDVLRQGPQ